MRSTYRRWGGRGGGRAAHGWKKGIQAHSTARRPTAPTRAAKAPVLLALDTSDSAVGACDVGLAVGVGNGIAVGIGMGIDVGAQDAEVTPHEVALQPEFENALESVAVTPHQPRSLRGRFQRLPRRASSDLPSTGVEESSGA